jgi:predicted Zn-dependent peptidase
MCAVAVLAPWLALVGCGGGPASGRPTADPASAVDAPRVHGARVVALRSDADGQARLSLFVDAGSRDADPPQVATLAALLAAEAAGDRFSARVLPDGTEIHGICPTAQLDDCIAGLGRALALRVAEPAALARAHRTLSARRRAARTDDARWAHRLALRALLGPEVARSLDPLGDPAGDADADGGTVAAFLEAHYGPSRSLLAATGDLETAAVLHGVRARFRGLPDATAARAERPELEPRTAVAVELGRRGTVTAAVPVASAAHGVAVARGLLEGGLERRLREREPVTVDAHAFDLRGRSLLLVRAAPLGDLPRAVRDLAFHVGRACIEADPARGVPAEPPGTDAPRAIGEAWIVGADARGPAPDGAGMCGSGDMHLSVGVVLEGGRADRPGEDDPDALVRRSAQGRLTRTLGDSLATLTPAFRGAAHDDGAAVVLDNGAQIDVRRTPGHRRVRIRMRVAGGAGEDPASLHGRTALLATAMTHGCAGLGSDALRLRLRELDASLVPAVGSEAFGMVLEAPRTRWREALDVVLACTTAPDLSGAAVERARAALMGSLAQAPPYRAWAARALTPRSPGLVAPWGAPDAVALAGRADLARAWQRLVVGARVHLTADGDVPPRDVVERAARQLARLAAGTAPAVPDPGAPLEGPLVIEGKSGSAAAVVAWRLGPGVDAEQAARFARRAGAALTSEDPTLRVPWTDGGRGPWGGWAALTVVVDREGIPPLRERALRTGRALAEAEGLSQITPVGPVLGAAPGD